MVDDFTTQQITPGTAVYGSDGEKIGDVADVHTDYVVVSKGFFFPKDHYIPTSAISTSDDQGLYLTVTKDQALNQGWDNAPESTTAGAWTGDYSATDQAYTEEPVDDAHLADQSGRDRGRADDSETIDVALTEEELAARTHAVERGAVRIEKDVVEDQQTLEVPVTEERVHVSRRTVDRDVEPGDTTFEESTIEVPVYGEEVDVEKRTRVREEIEVTKDVVQDTKRVTDTVRHEEARVVDETGAVRDDDSTASRR